MENLQLRTYAFSCNFAGYYPFSLLSTGQLCVYWIPKKLILGGSLPLMIEVERGRERLLRVPQQSINNRDEFLRGKEGIDGNRTLIARKHLICFPKDFGICQNIWLQKPPRGEPDLERGGWKQVWDVKCILCAKLWCTTEGSVFPFDPLANWSWWIV